MQRRAAFGRRDVGGDRMRLAAAVADELQRLLGGLDAALVADRDPSAGARAAQRDGATDAPAAAGDEHGLAGERRVDHGPNATTSARELSAQAGVDEGAAERLSRVLGDLAVPPREHAERARREQPPRRQV